MKKLHAWTHGIGLFALLYLIGLWTEYLFLEVAIVVILMFEIGFDMPIMKELMNINYDIIGWLKNFFNPPKRGKRRGTYKRRVDSDTQGV